MSTFSAKSTPAADTLITDLAAAVNVSGTANGFGASLHAAADTLGATDAYAADVDFMELSNMPRRCSLQTTISTVCKFLSAAVGIVASL